MKILAVKDKSNGKIDDYVVVWRDAAKVEDGEDEADTYFKIRYSNVLQQRLTQDQAETYLHALKHGWQGPYEADILRKLAQ